jgi:arylsulfatase A-like enzyme
MHCVGLVRLPGATHAGLRLDLPVTSIDLLPTVINYLGLSLPAGVEGQALDLAHPAELRLARTRFGEASRPANCESDPRWFNNPKARCVRQGPFKYIRTAFLDREELYDLQTDPYEQSNLLRSPTAEIAARAAEFRRKLDAWTAAQSPLPARFDDRSRDETVARLKALGYLDDDDEDDLDEKPP